MTLSRFLLQWLGPVQKRAGLTPEARYGANLSLLTNLKLRGFITEAEYEASLRLLDQPDTIAPQLH